MQTQTPIQTQTVTILLIEDDEEDYILLKKHLSRIMGVRYKILWEAEYESGLVRLLECQHDVCLLDYRLGARNGIELIAEARQRGYSLPIVLLTGAQQGEIDIQALQAGADDYIDKGHLQSELLQRIIRYAIERKKAEQERERLLREQLLVAERYQAEQERMRLLETLAFERAQFEVVLRNLPSGVIIAEAPSGKIVLGNQQVETLLRHPVHYSASIEHYGEWVGWHLDGRPVAPQEWPLAYAVRGESRSEEFKYQRGDGTICFIRINGAPIKDLGGNVVAGVVTIDDITAQKEFEYQQEAFVSMASHELKTPLTALQGNVQLAQRRLRRLIPEISSPEYQHTLQEFLLMLERSQRQLRVQNRLINDLLEMSRIHADTIELHIATYDLVRLVADTLQDQHVAHPQRTITLQPAEQETILVQVDPDRIEQVVNNYLTNALRYSPPDSSVVVTIQREDDHVRVSVRDYGPGLTPEAQMRIWQRFYQVPGIRVQSGSGAGLGLGLYICQQLIRRHGGQVGVESYVGQGSTFWFTLPLSTPGQK
jgi:nitrogen fixation/metabolism regulation signal transduction histidine kinase/CheY-like chemotaxis protein